MDKKTACCGCGCLLIIIIAVAIVVGGYYGVSFLHTAGKEVASRSFAKTIENVTEKAFNQADRQEIIAEAQNVSQQIKDGKIGLMALFQEGTQQLETGIYTQVILLGFKNHYLVQAEDGAEAQVSVDGARAVNRLLYGMNENRITANQIATLTMKITEHFQEKIKNKEGKGDVKFSSRRMNDKLSREEVQQCIQMINEVCDLNNVEMPSEEFDAENTVKTEILKVFERLKNSGAAEKEE